MCVCCVVDISCPASKSFPFFRRFPFLHWDIGELMAFWKFGNFRKYLEHVGVVFSYFFCGRFSDRPPSISNRSVSNLEACFVKRNWEVIARITHVIAKARLRTERISNSLKQDCSSNKWTCLTLITVLKWEWVVRVKKKTHSTWSCCRKDAWKKWLKQDSWRRGPDFDMINNPGMLVSESCLSLLCRFSEILCVNQAKCWGWH